MQRLANGLKHGALSGESESFLVAVLATFSSADLGPLTDVSPFLVVAASALSFAPAVLAASSAFSAFSRSANQLQTHDACLFDVGDTSHALGLVFVYCGRHFTCARSRVCLLWETLHMHAVSCLFDAENTLHASLLCIFYRCSTRSHML